MTKATESAAVETALATPFDFTTRDVAKKAEEGAELEVLDPVTNEPWRLHHACRCRFRHSPQGHGHNRQAPLEQYEGFPQQGA